MALAIEGKGPSCFLLLWCLSIVEGKISGADPDLVPLWPRDPGWTTRIIFPRAWKQFIGVYKLKFFDADPGSGIEKIRKTGKNAPVKNVNNADNPVSIRYSVSKCKHLPLRSSQPKNSGRFPTENRAGIFKEAMGARNRGGRGLSYRPARLNRLAEFIPWIDSGAPYTFKNTGSAKSRKMTNMGLANSGLS